MQGQVDGMDEFRGYRVREEEVWLSGRCYRLMMPADSEALLDDPAVARRFSEDEYMPYWATLWPAALVLAAEVASGPGGRLECLELGAGLGLVGIVAIDRGMRVTISEYDEDALAFCAENARRNELPAPKIRHVDWRRTYDDMQPELILAADVLYERRHHEPIAHFVSRHLRAGGRALVSDAHRSVADGFGEVARAAGLSVSVHNATAPGPDGVAHGRIFELRHANENRIAAAPVG